MCHIYSDQQMWLHGVAWDFSQCRELRIGFNRVWTPTGWLTDLPSTAQLVRQILGQNRVQFRPEYPTGQLHDGRLWLQSGPMQRWRGKSTRHIGGVHNRVGFGHAGLLWRESRWRLQLAVDCRPQWRVGYVRVHRVRCGPEPTVPQRVTRGGSRRV